MTVVISAEDHLKVLFIQKSHTDEQLALLMQYASNDFARWDAAQSLLSIYIKENIVRQQQREDLILPQHIIDAFKSVLLDEACDPAFRGCRKRKEGSFFNNCPRVDFFFS